MMIELTDAQNQLRETAMEFADKILIPNADRFDRREEFPKENIEKLADLKEKGAITEEEFATKKAELLDRL